MRTSVVCAAPCGAPTICAGSCSGIGARPLSPNYVSKKLRSLRRNRADSIHFNLGTLNWEPLLVRSQMSWLVAMRHLGSLAQWLSMCTKLYISVPHHVLLATDVVLEDFASRLLPGGLVLSCRSPGWT